MAWQPTQPGPLVRVGVKVDAAVLARLQTFVRAQGQTTASAGEMVDAALTSWLDAVGGELK